MKKGRSGSKAGILMIIWLMTAAAALIVTVIYFEELQELYSTVRRIEDAKANQVQVASTGGAATGANAGGQTGQQAGNKVGTDGVPGVGETGVPDYGTEPPAGGQTVSDGTDGGTAIGQGSAGEGVPGGTSDTGSQEGVPGGDSTAIGQDPAGEGSRTDGTSDTGAGEGTSDGTGGTDSAHVLVDGIDPDRPIIALSFDDGPSEYTDRILAALAANGVKATFFMVGYNVKAHPDQVRAVYEAGCEIGNHTTDHSDLKKLGADGIRTKVYDNEKWINDVVPVGEVIVRPPYGNVNSTVRETVERPMFNWSVDSLDWKTRNADSVVAQIQQDARDGYIILMHDLYESTAEATERIIPWLIGEGYQITTVSGLFKARGVDVQPGEVYRMATPDRE